MKQTLVNALRNHHTQKINFRYKSAGGVRYGIYASDFQMVATAVDDGRISVVEGGVAAGKAEYSLRKNGNKDANTFYIGQNNAAPNVFKSLLVHEAIHAKFDLNMLQMPWLDNEAIAYIAQGFYILSAGEDGGLSEQAYLGLEVARELQKGISDSSWADLLRDSLLNDPLYKNYINGNFMGDG